jgi:hypothetical protein
MKPVIFMLALHALISASPAWATDTTRLTFDERIALANAAQDDERFHPYAATLHKEAGPQIARLMRRCGTTATGAKPFALVADIDAHGQARNIVAQPDHRGARCFAKGFAATTHLRPPANPDGELFPMLVRVGHWR